MWDGQSRVQAGIVGGDYFMGDYDMMWSVVDMTSQRHAFTSRHIREDFDHDVDQDICR